MQRQATTLIVEEQLVEAIRTQNITMVDEILAACEVDVQRRLAHSVLHYAVAFGSLAILDLLLTKSLESWEKDPKDTRGFTPLHFAILYSQDESVDRVKLMVDKHLESGKLDVNAVDDFGNTALHLAFSRPSERIDIVRELLRCKNTMRLSEENINGKTPLEMAHERGFRDSQKALLEHESVRRYVEELYRDRQVYVDAANAILVGAALIASVTFGSWLQPPLGLAASDQHADIQHNIGLGAFWIFNNLSFYFAIATVVFGARSVLPRNVYFIKRTVEALRRNLLMMASMLASSALNVIIAFGIAGCIVVTPILKYQWFMIYPTISGGLLCLVSLGFLYWTIYEDDFDITTRTRVEGDAFEEVRREIRGRKWDAFGCITKFKMKYDRKTIIYKDDDIGIWLTRRDI